MLAGHVSSATRHVVQKFSASSRLSCRAYASSSLALGLTRPRRASRAQSTPALQWHHVRQVRGAKKKVTISLDEIPEAQGLIDGPPLPPLADEPDYPPLLQQVRNSMLKFSHCVLLTRVGGFYEVGDFTLGQSKANSPSCTLSKLTNMHHC